MKNSKKRGFTIIELVIVIAVIAILAGVLIPTFVSVINKANISSDTALVRNINEALAIEGITEQPTTMYQALQQASAYGYTIEKLTPRSTGDIVWNSASNRFALVDKDGNVVYSANDETIAKDYTIWKIAHGKSEISAQYSNYIAYAENGTLDVTTGVDVGNSAANINYSGSLQNVIVRTNGGTLTVNAGSGSVKHYGNADKITVEGNYNEFGGAKQIVAKSGTVTTQSSSVVTSIVAQPAADKTVTIDVTNKVAEVVVTSEYSARTTVVGTTAVEESKTIVNPLEAAKKYPANATSVPEGFVVDKTNKTIAIKDIVALMYYGYVLNPQKAMEADMSANGLQDFQSIWYGGAYHHIAVSLDADIDFEGAILETGMNVYGETFDANGHTIKNVSIKDSTSYFLGAGSEKWRNVGLFNSTRMSISNLKLENITIETITENDVKNVCAGILAGNLNAHVTNVEISNSSVSGGKYTGGVAGYSYGNITNCKLTDCQVAGQYKMGGVVGYVCAENTTSGSTIVQFTREINNNVLTNVSVTASSLMGSTKVIGKIVGNYNGSYSTLEVKGECNNNTFTGTCEGNWIGKVETATEFTFTLEQVGNK